MATATRNDLLPKGFFHAPALLASGDRMSQAEFHRRYEQYPESIKFELIKGTVYMASPAGLPHSRYTTMLTGVLTVYESETPGVEAASDPTVLLNKDSEPRPDLLLRISPDHGGQSWNDDLYLAGPPELVIEIAHSSVAIDLHDKKDDYQRNRVIEYIVVCVEEERIEWFDLQNGKSNRLPTDGILRSKTFPGLWIDTKALFRGEVKQLLRAVNQGLKTPEHLQFVRRLEKAARKTPTPESKHNKPTKSRRKD